MSVFPPGETNWKSLPCDTASFPVEHPARDLDVRLAPRRQERVTQLRPVLRLPQGAVADRHALAFEDVVRLDQPGVRTHVEPVRGRDGARSLLRALKRRCDDVRDVVA